MWKYELRHAAGIKYTLDFEDLIPKKEYKYIISNFKNAYMLEIIIF